VGATFLTKTGCPSYGNLAKKELDFASSAYESERRKVSLRGEPRAKKK